MMRRLYFLILGSVVSVTTAFSQSGNCTQTLRLITTTYEQGRLHELPAIAEGCLAAPAGKGFTEVEKKAVYRYLTLAYIYLEEPEKADESMLKFLETEHFYVPNSAVDPAEFIALYKKFRSKPLFRYGFKVGLNVTQPTTLHYNNVGSVAGGQGKYGLSSSFNAFLMFEKDVINDNFVFAPEIGYVSRSFTYSNGSLAKSDKSPDSLISNQQFAISQGWLDVNAILQYKLENTLARQSYIGIGPGASLLLSSSNQPTTFLGTGANGYTVTGPSIDDKKSYKSIVYSVSIVVGSKVKIGGLYLTADVRYQIGLSNVINRASRTNAELGFDYQGQYNDYRQSNIMVNGGLIIPYFKPKKLIK